MQLPIDEIVENGIVFNLRRKLPMYDIRATVRALFTDLRAVKVDYVLVGGVALLSYVPGRNTQDVDLIIAPKQLSKLDWQATVQDNDFGKANYHGFQVDLLLTTNPLFAYVQRKERTTITFDDINVPCATREGLLLLKLYALPSLYRQGNLARAALYETDILMLRQDAMVDEEQLLAILSKHLAAHDIDELRRILREQRERRRFT
ncbi:MAG TPA: hypothetical protein VGJ87_01060 [Roseiflexaceae bacterium]|jgi:hypothetical protein